MHDRFFMRCKLCYSILVKQDIKFLQDEFSATPIVSEFERFESNHKLQPKKYKSLEQNPRIYPGYHAPIITSDRGARFISPMRYRVRPSGSEKEVPTKYNLFNARSDSLTSRKTWQTLFMRNHGIVVFERFYEWVIDRSTGKKKVVSFKPQGHDYMVAPVLYDFWENQDNPSQSISSFALITREPPQEVLDAGHDRCPIFINPDKIDRWMNPKGHQLKRQTYHT